MKKAITKEKSTKKEAEIIMMTLLVWNKSQRMPATSYGNAHYGKGRLKIRVCKDPNKALAKIGKKKALIYHFASGAK